MARPAKSGPGQRAALRHDADALGHALPALLIEARRVAQSVMHGVHGRRQSGPGEEFWQYRAYAQGDSAAEIDWRKSARAERVLVRENEWMAANTLWLWVQTDEGMSYHSRLAPVRKAYRAALIALALATLATRAGERICAIGAPHRPGHTARAVEKLAAWIDPRAPAACDNLPPAAELPRFSTCVLIGDLFASPDALEKRIRQLAARGARGHLLQVVDPAEETFPFTGRTIFEDFASSDSLTLGKAEELRAAYQERLAAHRDHLKTLARRLDWTFQIHRTDSPPQAALLALHARIGGHRRPSFATGGRP